jgi:hypothetical protein
VWRLSSHGCGGTSGRNGAPMKAKEIRCVAGGGDLVETVVVEVRRRSTHRGRGQLEVRRRSGKGRGGSMRGSTLVKAVGVGNARMIEPLACPERGDAQERAMTVAVGSGALL